MTEPSVAAEATRVSAIAMRTVLLLDPDKRHTDNIAAHLRPQGFRVEAARTGREGQARLLAASFDLALFDDALPEAGPALLLWALGEARCRHVIVTSQMPSVARAVEVMRQGAADFLAKPLEAEDLDRSIARALGGSGAKNDLESWRRTYAPDLIGHDPATLAMLDLVRRVAAADCDVMVTGASGTGKELVARCLHRASARHARPFVPINCAAIPKDLIESEMFGHARGAFTGATERRVGRFEAAHGGTLFLDEAGEMDLAMQGKLLRVVQEREVTPVGESRCVKVNLRIVSATNQDLFTLCQERLFREDLFYRLNVVPIEVPALGDRPRDVPELAEYFLARAARRHQRRCHHISPAALAALAAYGWPGNIRELSHTIERVVVLKGDGTTVDAADLPQHLVAGPRAAPLGEVHLPAGGLNIDSFLAKVETRLTHEALTRANHNRRRAAELLGLKRTTLVERLKKLNLPVEADDEAIKAMAAGAA